MKSNSKSVMFLLLMVITPLAFSQGGVEQMEKVTIQKVKMIQLPAERYPDSNGRYFADIMLTIRNDNEHRLGLKDFDFSIGLKGSCGDETSTKVGDVKSEGKALTIDANNQRDVVLPTFLGTDIREVFHRLTNIMNIIGNPQNEVCLNLIGSCKVGLETSRGWYYQNNSEIDLKFQPKIQREVLVE